MRSTAYERACRTRTSLNGLTFTLSTKVVMLGYSMRLRSAALLDFRDDCWSNDRPDVMSTPPLSTSCNRLAASGTALMTTFATFGWPRK